VRADVQRDRQQRDPDAGLHVRDHAHRQIHRAAQIERFWVRNEGHALAGAGEVHAAVDRHGHESTRILQRAKQVAQLGHVGLHLGGGHGALFGVYFEAVECGAHHVHARDKRSQRLKENEKCVKKEKKERNVQMQVH